MRCPDVGDLVRGARLGGSFGCVGLVVDKRGIEILVLRESTKRWMRRDTVRVINESR